MKRRTVRLRLRILVGVVVAALAALVSGVMAELAHNGYEPLARSLIVGVVFVVTWFYVGWCAAAIRKAWRTR